MGDGLQVQGPDGGRSSLSILTLLPDERRVEEPQLLERVARGEHVQHYETVRLTKDGRSVPVSLSMSPILDGSGLVIGASKIARDMSARKRAEEALAKRADEQAALYEFTDRLFRARSPHDVYEAALVCHHPRAWLRPSLHSLVR